LRNIAGLLPGPVHFEHSVVVGQVVQRELQDGLGLERLHKGISQREQERALLIVECGTVDRGRSTRAVPAQLPLVLALMQVANAWGKLGSGERTPYSLIGRQLSTVRRQSEIRVRTQICGDLLGLGFVDRYSAGGQIRIICPEALADLLPCQRALSM